MSVLSCTTSGNNTILSSMVVPSMNVISSVNVQYGCRSLCTSALVDGQLHSTSSDSIPICSSSSIAFLIASAVMKSEMSEHDSIALMVIHMPEISSFLFVS